MLLQIIEPVISVEWVCVGVNARILLAKGSRQMDGRTVTFINIHMCMLK